MRTTLTLDDDVIQAVKERARRERRSIGAVVSDLVRQSLVGRPPSGGDGGSEFHGFEPLQHRGHPVTNALIDQLREDEPE